MSLDRLGRNFVGTLNDVLNGTVADGAHLTYVGREDGSIGWVGNRISRRDLTSQPIALGIGRAPPSCWLHVQQTLKLDADDGYLKTTRSSVAVFATDTLEDEDQFFRYDFNRDLEDYPTAHLQLFGTSRALDLLNESAGRRRLLHQLHLPVGGVRFRPCLEDVLEFLILEGFVEPRDDQWRQRLAAGRDQFHEVQLKAAVRNTPTPAIRQLIAMGFTVTEPS